MNVFSRIWCAVFGPYMSLRTDNAQILLQRGHYNQLLISAQDDAYGIQVLLTGEQADTLLRWMRSTGGSLNPPRNAKIIRLPSRTRTQVPDKKTDK